MKLENCDILLYINNGNSLKSKLSRWAIGRYDHVSMYIGRAFHNIPFIYESEGRGVCLGNIHKHTGKVVKVIRPIINDRLKERVISNAIDIASWNSSYYDHLVIVKSCLPRILRSKIPLLPMIYNPAYSPTPGRPYIRDHAFICSEAVAEAFWKSGIDILPQYIVPLPGDFENSRYVTPLDEGVLMLDIIP